jgi:hypothetical protein
MYFGTAPHSGPSCSHILTQDNNNTHTHAHIRTVQYSISHTNKFGSAGITVAGRCLTSTSSHFFRSGTNFSCGFHFIYHSVGYYYYELSTLRLQFVSCRKRLETKLKKNIVQDEDGRQGVYEPDRHP